MGSFYKADFTVYTHADWVDGFRLGLNDESVNLSDVTLTFHARHVGNKLPDFVLSNGVEGGINVLNAANGVFEINKPSGSLSHLNGMWRHELILTTHTATVLIWRGILSLRSGVSE